MGPNPQFPADLATFTEKIFNGKLQFLASYSLLKLIFNTTFSIFSLLFSLYINIVANKRIRNTHFNIFYRNILLLTNVKQFSNLL